MYLHSPLLPPARKLILPSPSFSGQFLSFFQKMSAAPEKPRKFRIPFLNRGNSSTTEDRSKHPPSTSPAISPGSSARDRHKRAISLLKEALEGRNEKWGKFDIPKIEGEQEDMDPVAFKKSLDSLVQIYSQRHDRTILQTCSRAVECCFTALAPFITNVLEIAKESSSVQ
jgi:hypothetical protein